MAKQIIKLAIAGVMGITVGIMTRPTVTKFFKLDKKTVKDNDPTPSEDIEAEEVCDDE